MCIFLKLMFFFSKKESKFLLIVSLFCIFSTLSAPSMSSSYNKPNSAQLNLTQLNSIYLNSTEPNSAQLNSTQLNPTQLILTQLNST